MKTQYFQKEQKLCISLSGDYLNYDDLSVKKTIKKSLQQKSLRCVVFKDDGLKKWDSSLLLILYFVYKTVDLDKISVDISSLPVGLQQMLNLARRVNRQPPQLKDEKLSFLECLGDWTLRCRSSFFQGLSFLRQVLSSLRRFFCHTAVMRKVDFLFALDECGPKAVGIVSLISFMVGLILAFVGALQLKVFGAQIYVASLVTVAMIRIMGAIMTGIIMAGRTGASYAANIGTMQVNEETDALKTMGISVCDFLVLPRLMSLILTMPLLTILADFMGIVGGAFVGVVLLDIPFHEYLKFSLEAFSIANFLVGVFHGFVFGIVIALCGCYFGIRCGKNADSVGKATTSAVVTSIVWMIVVTGIITLIFQVLGV